MPQVENDGVQIPSGGLTDAPPVVYSYVGDIRQFRLRITLTKKTESATHQVAENSEGDEGLEGEQKNEVSITIVGWEDDQVTERLSLTKKNDEVTIYLKKLEDRHPISPLTSSKSDTWRRHRECERRKLDKLTCQTSKAIIAAFSEEDHQILLEMSLNEDESLVLKPGLTAGSEMYSVLDKYGIQYSYQLENASLEPAVKQTIPRTRLTENGVFLPVCGVVAVHSDLASRFVCYSGGTSLEALRVLFMCNIESTVDFPKGKRYYVAYEILYDPKLWTCKPVYPFQTACIKGSTQLQKQTSRAKGFFAWERVCYFAHPVEAMFEAEEDPGATRWPVIILKVYSSRVNGSEACEGYTWASLYDLCPGSKQSTLATWKPQASCIHRLGQLFTGATAEVNSLESVAMPIQPGSTLSKYGLLTKSSGSVKIRTNSVVQQYNEANQKSFRETMKSNLLGVIDPGLISILRRARYRLDQAGEDFMSSEDSLPIQLNSELESQYPVITKQPEQDLRVKEGHSFTVSVQAQGHEPLHYQWYKNNERLSTNAENTSFFHTEVAQKSDKGIYTCKVSNKGGACQSQPCRVHIMTKRKTPKNRK